MNLKSFYLLLPGEKAVYSEIRATIHLDAVIYAQAMFGIVRPKILASGAFWTWKKNNPMAREWVDSKEQDKESV